MNASVALKSQQAYRTRLTAYGTLLLLLVSYLFIRAVASYSLWVDEVTQVEAALSFNLFDASTYTRYFIEIGHPPFYSVVLRSWIGLAGQSDFALSAMSFFFGILTVAVLFRIAVDVSGQVLIGIAAAALFAVLDYTQYYVRQVHNYALLMLLTALVILLFIRWWRCRERMRYSVGIALITALLLYTHYYSIYTVAILNLCALLLMLSQRRFVIRWFVVQGVAAGLYLPWLPFIRQLAGWTRGTTGEANVIAAAGYADSSPETFLRTINLLLDNLTPLYLLLLVIAVAYTLVTHRRSARTLWRRLSPLGLYLLLSLGCIGLALLANTVVRTYHERRIVYVVVALSLATAYCIALLPRRIRLMVLTLFMAAHLLIAHPQTLDGDWGFRQAIAYLDDITEPGDLIVFQFTKFPSLRAPYFPYLYYARQQFGDSRVYLTNDFYIGDEYHQELFASDVVLPLLNGRQRLWVVRPSVTAPLPEPTTLDWVQFIDGHRFELTGKYHFGFNDMYLFTEDGTPTSQPSDDR